MRRNYVILLVLAAFGLGVGAGILGILFSTGGLSEPSQDINEVAATLSLDGPTATPGFEARVATEIAGINTNLNALATQVGGLSAGNVTSTDTTADNAEATEEAVVPQAERALFRITQDESEARFRINEILMGNPTEVVGTTSQVAGDIIINFADPAASQLGEIAINVRTLRTDNEFRDQAIRGQILQTNANEFATFVPTELIDLGNDTVAIGDTVEFQIMGDLTVRGNTNTVTFDVSVTLVDENRIEGFASVQILYPDFGISINAPPNVGGIDEDLLLELDFVALEVEE